MLPDQSDQCVADCRLPICWLDILPLELWELVQHHSHAMAIQDAWRSRRVWRSVRHKKEQKEEHRGTVAQWVAVSLALLATVCVVENMLA